MCLACLTDRYTPIKMMGEYMFLHLEGGVLHVREVYDIFFRPLNDWNDAKFVCISPHDLVSGGSLAVTMVPTPGAGSDDDNVYKAGTGRDPTFDPDTGRFSVRVERATPGLFMPTLATYSGTVILPTIQTPARTQQDRISPAIMMRCGTIFELLLGNLSGQTDYAIRLVVQPYRLLGLPERRRVEDIANSETNPSWEQEGSIYSPHLCRLNIHRLLHKAREVTEFANSVANIQTIVGSDRLVTTVANRHRILVILPPNSSIDRETPMGCIWPVGVFTLPDNRRAAEWGGDTETYWMDDIESASREVWNYLSKWASAEPKTKEAVTAALGLLHTNCSLIIDALHELNAVEEIRAPILSYRAATISLEQRDLVCRELVTKPPVIKGFYKTGFHIRYYVHYNYLTTREQRRLKWNRFKQKWAFWLALIGVILTACALLHCIDNVVTQLRR